MEKVDLDGYGWTPDLAKAFKSISIKGLLPARVVSENKMFYVVMTEQGEKQAKISGSLRYAAAERSDLPAVGDWVAVKFSAKDETGLIHSVLPRRATISRKVPGDGSGEQVICTNVDYVFIISSVDHEFSLRRIERYISMAWSSGATPIVVLNKVDLMKNKDELEQRRAQIESIAFGVSVHYVSSITGNNLSQLDAYLNSGITAVLLGSSGVGKSTMTNYFLGSEQQKTLAVCEKTSKGRHTTRHRELFQLSSGALLIDTPGMRELQLWLNDDVKVPMGFDDVDRVARRCRFSDCTHKDEPRCAVREAVESGELDEERFKSFCKLKAELDYLGARQKEASWDSGLKDKQHGKLRHAVIKNNKKN